MRHGLQLSQPKIQMLISKSRSTGLINEDGTLPATALWNAAISGLATCSGQVR
jgi:hypothetical protein